MLVTWPVVRWTTAHYTSPGLLPTLYKESPLTTTPSTSLDTVMEQCWGLTQQTPLRSTFAVCSLGETLEVSGGCCAGTGNVSTHALNGILLTSTNRLSEKVSEHMVTCMSVTSQLLMHPWEWPPAITAIYIHCYKCSFRLLQVVTSLIWISHRWMK